jgi:hypothetical protein
MGGTFDLDMTSSTANHLLLSVSDATKGAVRTPGGWK